MDKKTLKRLFEASLKDFPEQDPAVPIIYSTLPHQRQEPVDEEDLIGHLGQAVNEYYTACAPLIFNGGKPLWSSLKEDPLLWFGDFGRVYEIIGQITEKRIKQRERALNSVYTPSRPKMDAFLQWLSEWVLYCGDRPIRYSWMKKQIVDIEKIVDKRTFDRYLKTLCDLQILEKERLIKDCKHTRRPKRKPNVYYKPNPPFFESRASPDQLVKRMPELFRIIARLAFEKNLAITYLKRNNLYLEFERENREKNSMLES